MRNLDLNLELVDIKNFIRNTLRDAGFDKVVLGLSGGIDSAVVASLCKLALGAQAVYGVMMPYKSSHPDSLADATLLAESLNILHETVDITEMVDSYFETRKCKRGNDPLLSVSPLEDDSDMLLHRGNFMARIRMCILYDLSAQHNALVVGTSNRSEIYAGYCTQYGDSACAFEPIAHLYKTEIKELATKLKIPAKIINKKPSADLWAGQTDEDDLGISYQVLDKILYYHLDAKKDKSFIVGKGVSKNQYDLVVKKINNSAFKRRMPLVIDGELG